MSSCSQNSALEHSGPQLWTLAPVPVGRHSVVGSDIIPGLERDKMFQHPPPPGEYTGVQPAVRYHGSVPVWRPGLPWSRGNGSHSARLYVFQSGRL
ncbi:hypothetical protein DPEC_G00263930 [Dallia pectoralis]|uniref:Uncharacterized protein n=1 Tax=Dallia pectoralis TaxID=75939 RepID=A0ACC2FS76_DALPE|nr:hypothetical protein DPEC_G00263930 [Dallia pectoralis]